MSLARALLVLFVLAAAPRAQDAPPPDSSAVAVADSASAQDRAAALTGGSGALGGYEDPFFALSALNAGLDAPGEAVNLQTPQAALEHFVRTGRDERWAEAAHVLNLNLVAEDRQPALAPALAEQLFYVIDTQLGFDWEGLPDRPDGAEDPTVGQSGPLVGEPRRSLRVGALTVGERDVTVRLQRVRVGEAPPVWVFSPQTVENVPGLYEAFGPGPVDRAVPAWARVEVLGQTPLWTWLVLLAAAALFGLLAWAAGRWARRALHRSDSHWVRGLGDRVAVPIAFVIGLFALSLFAGFALSLPGPVATVLTILLVAAVMWLASRAIACLTEEMARDQDVEDLQSLAGDEDTQTQHWLTYLSVGRRVLVFVVFLLGLGIVVGQFESFKSLGVSLMASAGVATVLLGIAAQPLLGNLVAGVQIALSKPLRIGDSVVYDGDWGYVEEITYTYVLIQTWDRRRLVVPLRHLVTHPFENWTTRDSHLIKPIELHADYTLDVDRVRDKFAELLRASDDWDEEKEPTVEVVAAGDETIEVRALCSAKDPSTAWDLHCALREQLVAYVRDLDGGAYLPRRRVALDRSAERQPANGTASALA
jgi:small-conductance mechanosensitive channel